MINIRSFPLQPILSFLLAVAAAMGSGTLPLPPGEQVYLFSYFVKNGQDGLHLAYSYDGLEWQVLNEGKPFLTPMAGRDKLMRDPCIIRGRDGRFHMVWTVSWREKGIGYAFSNDLLNWSEQRYIPVMEHEPNAKNCWAPELFYDATREQFLIFWATTIPGRFPETDNQTDHGPPEEGWNHRMYYTTTKDFRTFSETTLFYDHGFNVIDGTIVKAGARFLMFLKDETNIPFPTQKNIRIATATTAEGDYSPPSPPITGDYWAEGPTAIQIEGTWHVYFDKYQQRQYGVIVSEDLEDWTDISDRLRMPNGLRHGTVFEVSRAEFNRLSRLHPY